MARLPNVLITGTPGTGKTTTSEQARRCMLIQRGPGQVASATGLRLISVGDWVKEKELHSGWDAEHEAFILDEDKVCDAMEDALSAGGNVVDYHSCDFFPERWFDLVVVLQADNTVLYERLEKRGYPQAKVQENVQCEIMMVLLEEARDSYREEIVVPLTSNTVEEMESNVARITQWVADYRRQHSV
ncbi:putative adenylate kinase isoenzyme 6 [Monoraphidium neglectum]|uniref:Adenylate kinase isoenzyme 6 homolog n=1 Tax=Monoraphidium neglectum TaxID=145388 RepID=A0A0D2JNF1_9CHLO|nr:putative adenylate kinase isoenzyme 6 [Monoraphidium neglectum]KIZ00653.1 putative adenylate kinase isoenzyme 6 [Monoraphidium neglectum]|eukprot:XP_013899672.1 putative adenylate kinase isoenzyme 6 [Monoraphidium neglectum]